MQHAFTRAALLGLLLVCVLLPWQAAKAQVGIGVAAPVANAMLDVRSTTRGVLVPRLTTVQRTALGTTLTPLNDPLNEGMLVYDTDIDGLFYWDETSDTWNQLSTGSGTGVNSFATGVQGGSRAGGRYLFNISYTSGNNNPGLGAVINSSANGGNNNADGLAITATATGTGIGTGLNVNVTGGGTRYAGLFQGGNVGVGVATPAALLGIGAGTAARPSLNIATGVNPGTPVTGDIWVDATGNLFYKPTGAAVNLSSGGFALPYTQSLANAGPLFSLNNSDPAVAASSISASTSGGGTAIRASATGTGEAININQNGTGYALDVIINNAANNQSAIIASTQGQGTTITAINNNPTSGGTGFFNISNATNNSTSLSVNTSGTGLAGSFQINNASNGTQALTTQTNGSGAALNAFTTGTGQAAFFSISNPANTSTTMSVLTNGTGNAASFSVTNAASTAPTVATSHAGAVAAFQAANTGTGPAIVVPSFGRNVGFGTTTPNAKAILELVSPVAANTEQVLLLPRIGVAPATIEAGGGRLDPASTVNGSIYYNNTSTQLRALIAGSWVSLGAGGGGGVNYNVAAAQNTAVTPANFLFNVQYGAVAASVAGARIDATTTTGNATGLTLNATAAGASNAIGLNVSASGGAFNYAALFNGGNVGIGTTTPAYNLAVSGVLGFFDNTVAAANGANNDFNLGAFGFARITSPTAPFTITGIASPAQGKLYRIYNASGQSMTIADENAGSTVGNRIRTLTGADLVIANESVVTVQYSAGAGRWIVVNSQNASAAGGGANLDLSNLTPTSINQNLRFAGLGAGIRRFIIAPPSAANSGDQLQIAAGDANTTGNGGAVSIAGGNPAGTGSGGAVGISVPASVGTNISGGAVTIASGSGTGTAGGGAVSFTMGNGGPGAGSQGGNFVVNGGTGFFTGSNILLRPGTGTSFNGAIGLGTSTSSNQFLAVGPDNLYTYSSGGVNALDISPSAAVTGGNAVGLNVNVSGFTGGGTKYAAIFAGGNVGIGTAAPTTLLDIAPAIGGVNTTANYTAQRIFLPTGAMNANLNVTGLSVDVSGLTVSGSGIKTALNLIGGDIYFDAPASSSLGRAVTLNPVNQAAKPGFIYMQGATNNGTGAGGDVSLYAGESQSNTANGGDASISGGLANGSGAPGGASITAQGGQLPSDIGGSIVLLPGNGTTSSGEVRAFVHTPNSVASTSPGTGGATRPALASGNIFVANQIITPIVGCSSVVKTNRWLWSRIGNIVNVSGTFTFIGSAATATCSINLPVPCSATANVAGTATAQFSSSSANGSVESNSATLATVKIIGVGIGFNHTIYFTYSYEVN